MEPDQKLVSVLISAYNAEHFLLDTIVSILDQTYRSFELLILDDNSKDNTYGLHTKISDPRMRWFKGDISRGPYGGLNFLLDQAKGSYIAIQDHDDFWHPKKLEKQIEFLELHPEYIGCGTRTLMWYEGDQQGFQYYLGEKNYYTIHPSLVFRNRGQRYPLGSIYFNDALFQKKALCNNDKKIFNLYETLTLHLVKEGAKNFSYKRFTFSWSTFQTVFTLHPAWYSILVIGWESFRKLMYPLLQHIGKSQWIDILERKPFQMMGNSIQSFPKALCRTMGFRIK